MEKEYCQVCDAETPHKDGECQSHDWRDERDYWLKWQEEKDK